MNGTKRVFVLSNVGLGCLVALICSWLVFKGPLARAWLDHRLRELGESERWELARKYEETSSNAARVAEAWYLEVLERSSAGDGALVTIDDYEAADGPRSVRFYQGEEDGLAAAERLVAMQSRKAVPLLLQKLVAFAESELQRRPATTRAPRPGLPRWTTRPVATRRVVTRRVTTRPTTRSSVRDAWHFTVYALSKLGSDAVPTLQRVLSQPRIPVRREAIQALSLMGDPARAAEGEVLELLFDSQSGLRLAALDLLLSWDPAAPRAVTRLLSLFYVDPTDASVFVALAKIAKNNRALVGSLVRRLADVGEELDVQTRSAQILCLLGPRANFVAGDVTETFVQTFEDSERGLLLGDVLTSLARDESVRLDAIQQLSVFRGISSRNLSAALLAVDSWVRPGTVGSFPTRSSTRVLTRTTSLSRSRTTRSFSSRSSTRVPARTTSLSRSPSSRSFPSRLGSGRGEFDDLLEKIHSLVREPSPSR